MRTYFEMEVSGMRRSLRYGSIPCIVFTWLGMRARCTVRWVGYLYVRPARRREREIESAFGVVVVQVECARACAWYDMLVVGPVGDVEDLVCKTVHNQRPVSDPAK